MLLYVSIALMLTISIIFIIFDIFNQHNIPTLLVLICLIFALIYSIIFNSYIGLVIASLIIIVGLGLHRIKFLGFADSILLAILSLLMPFQKSGLLVAQNQLGLPFVLTLITNLVIPLGAYIVLEKLGKYKQKHTSFTSIILISLVISLCLGNILIFLISK